MCIPSFLLAQKVLYSDTFTGVNGQRPQNWRIIDAPEQEYWYLQDGQFATGNGDNLIIPGGHSYAVVTVPGSEQWSNYVVECTAWMSQRNGRVILVGRWLDKNNHYQGVLECYEGKRLIKIVRVQNGEQTMLTRAVDGEGVVLPAIESSTGPSNSKYFKLVFFNDEISFTYDTVSITAKDSIFTKGTAGLGQWYNFVFFDSFVVKEATTTAAIAKPSVSAVATPSTKVEEKVATPQPGVVEAVYQLVVASDVDQQIAQNLRDQLQNWGYVPVEVKKTADNKYEVLLGAFLTEEEANRAKNIMEKDGLIISRVVYVGGKSAIALQEKQAEPEKRLYQVLIQEFADERSATQLKLQMENEGFVALEILPEGGKYKVLAGQFVQESEANKFAQYLKNEGYVSAQIVATRVRPTMEVAAVPPPSSVVGGPAIVATPAPVAIPEEVKQMTEWQRLSEEERRRVMEAIQREYAVRGGSALAQEIEDLRAQLRQLTNEQKTIVQTVRQKFEEQENLKRQVSKLLMDVDRAIDSQRWEEALALLVEVERMDPTNAKIDLKRRAVEMGRKNVKFEGQDFLEEKFKKEIAQARSSAEEYERMGNFLAAISSWEIVKSKTDPTSIDYQEAARKIGELKDKQRALQMQEQAKTKRLEMIGYVAVGLIVAMLIVVMLVMWRTKKRDRELLRQVQEIALKPLMELGEGRQLELPEKTSPVETEPKFTPAATTTPSTTVATAPSAAVKEELESVFAEKTPSVEERQAMPSAATGKEKQEAPGEMFVTAEEELFAEANPSKPKAEEVEELIGEIPLVKEAEPVKASIQAEEEIVIGDLDTLFAETEQVKSPAEKTTEEIPELVSLDSLMAPEIKTDISTQETKQVQITPEIVEPQIITERKPAEVKEKEVVSPALEPATSSLDKEKTEIISMPSPEIQKEVAPKPEAPLAKVVEGRQIIFEQNFDDEVVGQPPKGWANRYDYATLVVTDETPAPNSTHCLKYEKKSGAGSAFYSCRFPDARGTVQIEFDLRCDEKNKYLLGVYIEKDGDFRQSIHTIIHRTEAQTAPSLRIHGEPVPYLFGTWRRIRYIIDLNEGTVDGFIDDKLVANRGRLSNNPRVLNTISIRDNLATTGVLKIDNIRITCL